MRCNACWRKLEGRAVATTCGHIFCTEDASKILTCDSSCPLCEQILSKSQMKAVDLNPNDEWVNMVMAGIPPQCIMKSAFKGVIFWIEQKDVEAQLTVTKARQLHKKYEEMQSKYMQKIEQVHSGYQKAMKKIQALEQEKESLAKDNAELQEKFAEKSRSKRKLEEVYDALRNEYEKLKRSAIQPKDCSMTRPPAQYTFASSPSGFEDVLPRTKPDEPALDLAPATPVQPADLWSGRPPNNNLDLFDLPALPPARRAIRASVGVANRQVNTLFNTPDPDMFPATGNNPSNALRNLLLSPLKRPPSRPRPAGLK
ncbi:hypothetical protein O6H91_08G092200 [Diphasiastrum complanatum]|uniref:Uncharacterized protein n=2 Tax=Diphasiastrum complanatum TaxID=34168 RepID=A0ACC2CZX2_DIPCM|nr:hypothetical protein O6H91_08G092200 [Diphasiastrum complanatum]KAJ7547564.1 hypothetical protein O6H91_08G092200 [Diphasiastrum complanatum]